jgi:hypothetical protein
MARPDTVRCDKSRPVMSGGGSGRPEWHGSGNSKFNHLPHEYGARPHLAWCCFLHVGRRVSVDLVLSENYVRTDVMVVQSGQDRDGDNGTGALDRPTQGRVLAQCQVRADLIVVRCISRKNLPQVRRTKDQHPVQALAAHGANQTLHIRILPWRSRRDRSVADTMALTRDLKTCP